MEQMLSNEWLLSAGFGFIWGGLIVWLFSRNGKNKVNQDFEALNREYRKYRKDVNAHFAKTADAVDSLTKSYKDVFTHLSDGAEHLMDKEALQEQLNKRQGKSVTLAYLVDAAGGAHRPTKVSQETIVNRDATTQKIDPATDNQSDKPQAATTARQSKVAQETSAKTDNAPVAEKNSADGQADAGKDADSATPKTDAASAAPASAAEKTQDSGAHTQNTAQTDAKQADAAQPEKTPAQVAAEKAGLNTAPAKPSASSDETAIESVKRHIRNNNQESV